MATQPKAMQISRDQEAAVHRRTSEFQEAPGEAEAEAVRDAVLRGAGPDPAAQAAALSGVDGATRARAIGRLQREQGNAYVQRVMAEARGAPGRLVGLSQPEMVAEVRQRQDTGSPLPDDARGQMEGYFGADLGGVRVHTGGEAAALNRELSANAFTVGSDIFFADGRYSPGSTEGRATLAHELTHVGQQTGFTPSAGGVQRASEAEEALQTLGDPALQRAGMDEEDQVQTLPNPALQREGAPNEEEDVQRQPEQGETEEEEEAAAK
jgi:hypothetical protein